MGPIPSSLRYVLGEDGFILGLLGGLIWPLMLPALVIGVLFGLAVKLGKHD